MDKIFMRLSIIGGSVAFISVGDVESIKVDGANVVLTTCSGSTFYPELHDDGAQHTANRIIEDVIGIIKDAQSKLTISSYIS